MVEYLKVFIDSLFVWIAIYFIGKVLFNEKSKFIRLILSLLLFSAVLGYLNYINSEILNGTIKILTVYYLFCLYIKINFNKHYSKTVVASLIIYIAFIISEVIIMIISSVILKSLGVEISTVKNSILMNFLISAGMFIIIYLFKDRLKLYIENSDFKKKSKRILIIVILINLALLGYKLPVTEWKLSVEFIVTMLILLIFCLVGVFMLKQNYDMVKTASMYQQVIEYSKTTNKLLEDYRIINHEHKNQLSIIRQMTDPKNKRLIEYLDNLLEQKNVVKYPWISSLNNLPSEGLKGLLNYKLVEMSNCGITPIVNISKDISKLKLDKLSTRQKDSLYSIAGVYLDNAMEAAEKSKEKRINLNIYKDKTELVIIIGNTYKGDINIDRIDDYGYSTKGKNRGVGLHIVRNILDNNTIFSVERRLIDNYYIQELRVNLNNKIKKKKTTK